MRFFFNAPLSQSRTNSLLQIFDLVRFPYCENGFQSLKSRVMNLMISLLDAWKNLFWLVLFWIVEFLTQRFANQQHVVPCWMCTLNRNSIPSISASDFEVFRAAKMGHAHATKKYNPFRPQFFFKWRFPPGLFFSCARLYSSAEPETSQFVYSSSNAKRIGFDRFPSCHYVFFRTTSSTTAFLIWKDHQKIAIFRPLLFESNLRIFQFSLQI